MSEDFGCLPLSDKIEEIVKFEKGLAKKLREGDKKLVFGDQEIIRYNHRTAHVYEIGDGEYVDSIFKRERLSLMLSPGYAGYDCNDKYCFQS